MKTRSLLVLAVLLAVAAIAILSLQGGGPSQAQGMMECTMAYQLPDIAWTFEGVSEYQKPNLRLDGTLVSENGSSDLTIIYDGRSMFAYIAMKPLSRPAEMGWYDVSDIDMHWVNDFMDEMDTGAVTGASCKTAGRVNESTFELPGDVVVDEVPPGGMSEYY
jgi:hypothetical protein